MDNPIEACSSFSCFNKEESFVLRWQFPQYFPSGQFFTKMCEALILADETQLSYLAEGYPHWVGGLKTYRYHPGWWDSLKNRAKEEGLLPAQVD